MTTLLPMGAAAHARVGASTSHGPSTPIEPYVLPVAVGVEITSLLTVDGVLGDGGAATNGYEMVGIPDGLGAMEGPGRDFTLFMNHELNQTQGVVRAHGQLGAFVSRWEIDPRTLEVEKGSDLIQPGVHYWNYVTQRYQDTPSPAGDNPRTFGSEQPNVTQDDFAAQPAPLSRTRRRASKDGHSRRSRTAPPSSFRASACSRGRTLYRPPTDPTRRWSSAPRTPRTASFGPMSATSGGAGMRSTAPA